MSTRSDGQWDAWMMVAPGRRSNAGCLRPLRRSRRATVEVSGCGVCHTDLSFLHHGVKTRGALPPVLGHEISGVVREVGDGVDAGLVRTRRRRAGGAPLRRVRPVPCRPADDLPPPSDAGQRSPRRLRVAHGGAGALSLPGAGCRARVARGVGAERRLGRSGHAVRGCQAVGPRGGRARVVRGRRRHRGVRRADRRGDRCQSHCAGRGRPEARAGARCRRAGRAQRAGRPTKDIRKLVRGLAEGPGRPGAPVEDLSRCRARAPGRSPRTRCSASAPRWRSSATRRSVSR